MWSYNGEEFTSEMIGGRVVLDHSVFFPIYFFPLVLSVISYTNPTRPPLKGKKRKRKIIKESDWQDYYGSSEEVKSLVEEHGRDRFDRKILFLCNTKGEMSYMECYYQMINHVLLKPDEYYNGFVGMKIHRSHVKNLKIEDI